MATTLPEKLRKADLHRFSMRAAQLQKARPIVTYWCEYYILQQVLGQKLNVGDDEASNYAATLLDKLEATKSANATNDAIVDDLAAKAYIENFALETFARADDSQRTGKVTKQTADTFMAAATFIDLLAIWGEVERDVAAKSKFAKYHARRILQAIKAGEDPNATNPVVEEVQQPQQRQEADEDGLDAELKALESQQQNGAPNTAYQPLTVENVEPGGMPLTPQNAFPGDTAIPPTAPPAPQQNSYQVSPIEPPETTNSRHNSIGGGYFPSAPAATAPTHVDLSEPPKEDEEEAAAANNMPPPDEDQQKPETTAIPPPTPPSESMNPQDFYNTAAPAPPSEPSAPSPRSLGISSPARPSRPPPPDEMNAQPPAIQPVLQQQAQTQHPVQNVSSAPLPPPAVSAPSQLRQQQLAPTPITSPATTTTTTTGAGGGKETGFKTDDEATAAAQKHARWAISALNFEDVNTAVKELRLALQSLGAG